MNRLLRLILTGLWPFVLVLSGCAVNPVTGKNELSLISEGEEIQLGSEQYVPAQQSQGGQFRVDPELTKYVSEVGQKVAAHSDRKLPYEFVVLNNPVPNAWALPGGKIAVNRGLLLELDSEAELAAVLGHEIVHAAARHGAKSYERGMLLQGVVLATAVYASDKSAGNYIVQGAGIGAQLVSQKYGRDAEREADHYGMKYMAAAGYNPEAAVTLQEKFVKLSEGHESNWLEGLFASHPPSRERVEANRAALKEFGTSGEWDKDRYAQKMAYLERIKPAYDAQEEAEKALAKKDTEKALELVEKAIKLEPKEAQFYGTEGAILLQQQRNRKALEAFDEAVQRDSGYFQYFLGRGMAHQRLGDRDLARADFERSNQLLPTAQAMNELGQLALAGGDRMTAKKYFKSAAEGGGDLGQNARRAFVELDLADNPNEYIKSQALLAADGRVLVEIMNGSGMDVRDLRIQFRAQAGERQIVREQTLPRLAAGAEVRIDTGVNLDLKAPLSGVKVLVVGVSIQ